MKFMYFGDKYLEYHDYLQDLNITEIIEAQINLQQQFILPHELGFYIGIHDQILNKLKCVKEIKKEKDPEKHIKILEKYGLNPQTISQTPEYLK